jgi:hypothetical protein
MQFGEFLGERKAEPGPRVLAPERRADPALTLQGARYIFLQDACGGGRDGLVLNANSPIPFRFVLLFVSEGVMLGELHLASFGGLSMKTLAIVTYSAALAAGISLALVSAIKPVRAQNPGEPSVCLEPMQIRSTEAKDEKTIIFRMRNGEVWSNTLVARCPGLKSINGGWTQQVTFINRICSYRQRIFLNVIGQSCRLGAFTRVQ